MSYTDDDFHSLFIEHVELHYEPAEKRSDILRLAKANQKDCTLLWRRIARNPVRYVSTLKNRCIKELYEKWMISENSHHH